MKNDSNHIRRPVWAVCRCGSNTHVDVDRHGTPVEVAQCSACKEDDLQRHDAWRQKQVQNAITLKKARKQGYAA